MNSQNNRILRLETLKQNIQSMSPQSIVQYAKNDPIIPLENTKQVISENAGHAGTVQSYCNTINVQPNLKLEDIPSIIPSQQLARENTDYWLASLNPKMINTYTQVKQFCNYYSALTDQDIDYLVDNINEVNGKDNFIKLMNDFKAKSDKNGDQAIAVASDLSDFDLRLAEDLSNFEKIKQQVDERYLGEDGKLQQLQGDMKKIERTVADYDDEILTVSYLVGAAVLISVAGIFLSPVTIIVLVIGLIFLTTTVTILINLKKKRDEASARYKSTIEEFGYLQSNCASLQTLSNNFISLDLANSETRTALHHMTETWQTIGNNFLDISDIAQEPVNENTQLLLKTQLTNARKDAQDLKQFAENCELNGVLSVKPGADIIHTLCLPQSWVNQTIPGDVFRDYIAAKRHQGFFDRGRSGWRTRNRKICVSLSRLSC